jgi:hypothetical protein
MKRTNLFLLCLMAYLPVFSQVDTIADNIYEYNGNLGIGTENPLSKLEVNGMIHSTSEGFKFPDGTVQITAANGSGDSYWNPADDDIYYNNGSVGIGRTSFDSYFDTRLWINNGWLQVTD